MTTFAEKQVIYSDGQVNVVPLPEAIMANGFTPETRDAPGMPLAAQHLNWLFRDLYRKATELQQTLEQTTDSADNALKKNNNLSDLTNVDAALINLKIKDKILPAWVPIPCPMATPPAGYFKCDGQAFDKTKYPELAKGYPSGRLPDLRGEFIRGLDDGRGVDTGRVVLSWQGDEFKLHVHRLPTIHAAAAVTSPDYFDISTGVAASGVNPAMAADHGGTSDNSLINPRLDSQMASGGRETRPRNVAFLYIVRAA